MTEQQDEGQDRTLDPDVGDAGRLPKEATRPVRQEEGRVQPGPSVSANRVTSGSETRTRLGLSLQAAGSEATGTEGKSNPRNTRQLCWPAFPAVGEAGRGWEEWSRMFQNVPECSRVFRAADSARVKM